MMADFKLGGLCKGRKHFFFEKKKQKTFVSALAQPIRPWPGSWERWMT
jgi:hypothetical protein